MNEIKNDEMIFLEDEELLHKERDLEEEKYFVTKGMQVYGDGFCLALATLIQRADKNNLEKIYNSFNKEWEQYLEMGRTYDKKFK